MSENQAGKNRQSRNEQKAVSSRIAVIFPLTTLPC